MAAPEGSHKAMQKPPTAAKAKPIINDSLKPRRDIANALKMYADNSEKEETAVLMNMFPGTYFM